MQSKVKDKMLLGGLSFVTRTFEAEFDERHFKESPYVLDMDANLYIGPADHVSRDEHSGIEAVFQFLTQTGRIEAPFREILRDRTLLLAAYAAFDDARGESESEEFRIHVFGTYDGTEMVATEDDDLPAGPCGKTVNEVKIRFYKLCKRLDNQFDDRDLTSDQKKTERRFLASAR